MYSTKLDKQTQTKEATNRPKRERKIPQKYILINTHIQKKVNKNVEGATIQSEIDIKKR